MSLPQVAGIPIWATFLLSLALSNCSSSDGGNTTPATGGQASSALVVAAGAGGLPAVIIPGSGAQPSGGVAGASMSSGGAAIGVGASSDATATQPGAASVGGAGAAGIADIGGGGGTSAGNSLGVAGRNAGQLNTAGQQPGAAVGEQAAGGQGGQATGGQAASNAGGQATGGQAASNAGGQAAGGQAGQAASGAGGSSAEDGTAQAGSSAQPEDLASGLSAADKSSLESIRDWSIVLQSEVISFWLNYGPDPLGGFHGSIGKSGEVGEPTDKFVHQQARHLWSMSFLYRTKQPTEEVRAIAADLRLFLAKFKDTDGQYLYALTREGDTVVDSTKLLYAQAFVILALSEYSRAFDDTEAAAAALEVFSAIDGAMHDAVNGGYDQTDDPWFWIVEGATKSLNVHMHLLESFTNLYLATSDTLVRARLEELVSVFTDKIAQPDHYLHLEFSDNWQPLIAPPIVEYGHDLQGFWLMTEALSALDRQGEAAVLDTMLPIAEHSALNGLDANNDGYHQEGSPTEAAVDLPRQWWVQAECMNGLLKLYQTTGDSVQLERILLTMAFVDAYQKNPGGEWHTALTLDNAPDDEEEPRIGWEWKASYHTIRSSLLLEKWSNELLAE